MILVVATAIAQIAMLLYITNAACAHARSDKRGVMRAVALTAIVVIVVAVSLQALMPDKHFVAVKEVAELGFIFSCLAACAAVHLLKRIVAICDKRTK